MSDSPDPAGGQEALGDGGADATFAAASDQGDARGEGWLGRHGGWHFHYYFRGN